MYATKLKMKPGCYLSRSLTEIDEIYITGCSDPGYYKKAILHDYLKEHPGTILVNISPYQKVIPAVSIYGEKYVRSAPDRYSNDDLLNLPREF